MLQPGFKLTLYEFLSLSFWLVTNILQVSVAVLPYGDAANICGGSLPDYIPQVRTSAKYIYFSFKNSALLLSEQTGQVNSCHAS